MSMKYGIMGASGRLGRKTLDAVLGQGTAPSDIVALVRSPNKLTDYAALGVDVRWADYDDPSSLMEAYQGVDRLLLVPSLAMPAERVHQYYNAISAARKAGTTHLLHYSLVSTFLESPFVITPFLVFAESAIRTSGLKWTILRNGLYADPIVEWVPDIVEMGTIPYPTGAGRCGYVARDDIARAGAAVLTGNGHDSKVFNLTGPAALTTSDLCREVATVTGKPVKDTDATDEDYLESCKRNQTPEVIARMLLTMYHAIRRGFTDVISNDIETLTGQPAERFEDHLRRTYKASVDRRK
jgi:NAD(P)H dehydrogenase (quinone)